MAVWSQVKVRGRGLSLRPECTLALSVTQQSRCSCGTRLVAMHKSDMPLRLQSQYTVLISVPKGYQSVTLLQLMPIRPLYVGTKHDASQK